MGGIGGGRGEKETDAYTSTDEKPTERKGIIAIHAC